VEVIELKEKLLATSPFEVVEKIVGTSQKVAEKLLMWVSSPATCFGSNETSKPDRYACMHGSRLFRYVRVNYPYKKRIQAELY